MSRKVTLQVNAPGFQNDELVGQELIGFNYVETLEGCSRFALVVQSQRGTAWNSFIKNDEEPFTMRFGTEHNVVAARQSRLKTLRTLWSSRQLKGNASAIFTFKGTCNGVALNLHRAKDKHWKQTTISGIVEELITDAGLEPAVAQTDGFFTLMGCNLPTGKFIRRVLLPLAYSDKGRDWRIWVEDGKRVHFEPTEASGNKLKFTNLFRDGWIQLKSPKVVKDTRFSAALRTGKIEVMMYDQDSDRLIRRKVGENQGRFNYSGIGRPKERENTSESIVYSYLRDRHTDIRPDKLMRQIGQTVWGEYGRSLYRLVGLCGNYEPGISVNQPAVVDLAGPLGAVDVNSGNWIVVQVKNINSRGQVKTFVVLEKRWER